MYGMYEVHFFFTLPLLLGRAWLFLRVGGCNGNQSQLTHSTDGDEKSETAACAPGDTYLH